MKPTIEDLREQWLTRGFRAELHADPPDTSWEQVVHGVDALFMLLEGSVELITAGLTRKPAVGDELVLPAGTVHTVRNSGRNEARWVIGFRVGHADPH